MCLIKRNITIKYYTFEFVYISCYIKLKIIFFMAKTHREKSSNQKREEKNVQKRKSCAKTTELYNESRRLKKNKIWREEKRRIRKKNNISAKKKSKKTHTHTQTRKHHIYSFQRYTLYHLHLKKNPTLLAELNLVLIFCDQCVAANHEFPISDNKKMLYLNM